MIYPESQYKIYSGRLISVEMELEKIQDRIEMSSFILLATAVITFLYLIFQFLEYGFNIKDNTITIITILLFFALWRFSFKYPLISFIIGFTIYTSNLIVYFQNSSGESLNFVSYRIVVPVILFIGIFN